MQVTCEKILKYLHLDEKCNWNLIKLNSDIKLENIEPLFTRLENN